MISEAHQPVHVSGIFLPEILNYCGTEETNMTELTLDSISPQLILDHLNLNSALVKKCQLGDKPISNS